MSNPSRMRQRGIVLPIVAIALTVLIGMAGLALDLARGYLDKARLQTAVDAAALAGAKVVNELGNTATAQQDAADAAVTAFDFHLEGDLAAANAAPVITFSTNLAGPFAGAPVADARYVRAVVAGLPSPILLARVIPGVADNLTLDASAVAGPSPPIGTDPDGEVCDLAPMLACANDPDADDFGLDRNTLYALKMGSQECPEDPFDGLEAEGFEIGHGNFGLAELECPGGDCVREALADSGGCTSVGDTIRTKPGNTVGPTIQGYETRFNIFHGPINPGDYPPDTIVTTPLLYSDYLDRQANGPLDILSVEDDGIGVANRRVLAVPVGPPCDGGLSGNSPVDVLGFACFFMIDHANAGGQQGHGNTQCIYGQFIGECEAAGEIASNPGNPGPGGGPELYKIILYNDMASADS